MAEIKRSESGKRYSRIVQRTFENLEEGIAEWKSMKPFQEQVTDGVNCAREFLRSRGLPDAPRMVKSRKTGEWEPYNGQTVDEALGGCSLDNYILKVCGLERDSFEHLAARFILAALEMQLPERERAIRGAFEVGQLNVLTRVYGMQSQHSSVISPKNRERRWAKNAAEYLVRHGASTPAQARELVPYGSPLELDEDHAIYRDGEKLCCIDPVTKGEVGDMTWENFTKRYLRKKIRDTR